MRKAVPFILSTVLVLTAGCSLSKLTGNSDKPIIKINDAVITQGMFDKSMDKAIGNMSQAKGMGFEKSNDNFFYSMYKYQVIDELVDMELINQGAKKYNITVNKDEIDKTAAKVTQQLGGEAKLEAALKERNITKEHFLNNVKHQIIIEKLIAKEAGTKKVTDQDVISYYNKNKAVKFSNPDLVKAQHILISANEAKIKAENPKLSKDELDKKYQEALDNAKAKAEKILAQVKAAPAKFGDLAKMYSEDKGSAANNGDLGFFSKKDMVPEFSKAAFSLKPGQISELVKTDFGYHIIKVTDTKKASVTPFESVKDKIRKDLEDQIKYEAFYKMINTLKTTSKIVYVDPQYNPDTIGKQTMQLMGGKQPGKK